MFVYDTVCERFRNKVNPNLNCFQQKAGKCIVVIDVPSGYLALSLLPDATKRPGKVSNQ